MTNKRGFLPRFWPALVLRVALATVAAALGYGAVIRSLVYTSFVSSSQQAAALAPGDGRVSALLSEILSGPSADAAMRLRADAAARVALLRDPTAVRAIATLGVDAEVRGDTPAAERLFAYGQRLSRRDLRTQAWAIENAVSHGDIASALYHYDIAMRVIPATTEMFFPILASATGDPTIRAEVVRTIDKRPSWAPAFIEYVSGHTTDPRNAESLLMSLQRHGTSTPDSARAVLVAALLEHGFIDDAWSTYTSGRIGDDRRQSRDPSFSHRLANPAPFDWIAVNGSETSVSLGGGAVSVSAPAGIGGPLLRQLEFLPPGTYSFEGRSTGVEQPGNTLPYWTLTCLDGRELGRVVVPRSAEAGGAFVGLLVVPPGCGLQYLTLVARPSESVGGLDGQIERAWLHPQSRASEGAP